MRLGRTTFVYFVSRVAATVVGFAVTIILARELGAEILGIYYLVTSVVSGLTLLSTLGIKGAIGKRLSEGDSQGGYLVAGGMIMGGLLMLNVLLVLAFRIHINRYIGYPVAAFVILLMVVGTTSSYIIAVLVGQDRVHVVGILVPIRTITRGIFQVMAVLMGFGVLGILLGHALGTVASIMVGALAVSFKFRRPMRKHFSNLFSFAQFSWLGQVRGSTFNRLDIIILGFFVSSGLIGTYSISWNIASFLGLFASSMSASLFPKLSSLSAQDKTEDIREFIEQSISFAGLIHVPGIIGAMLLGDRILRIYGDEFIKGQAVLAILVLAYLVHGYNQQILTALDSIDRPDLTFRSNAVLVVSNVLLNVSLVYLFGWVGAAVATTLSVGLSLAIGYRYLSRLIEFEVPIWPVMKQLIAGILMGLVVFAGVWTENTFGILSNNVATVLILVGSGAGIYFSVLFTISKRFRGTVRDNFPISVPV